MEIVRWIALAAVCVLAYAVGEGLARVHIPRLPVYLFVGLIAGQLVLVLRPAANLAFPVLNPVTLCVIGFVAGSHLIWQVIRPRIRPIAYQVVAMTVVVPIVVGVALFFIIPSSVALSGKMALIVLVGSVMIALSPPEAIAIIFESRAAGPFTKLVLGATVVMDVVVVSMFSAALALAKALLGGEASIGELLATVGLGIVLAAVGGVAVGWLLRMAVDRLRRDSVVGVAVFVLAAVAVALATYFGHAALKRFGLDVEIEPLLVAMIAGLFVANTAKAPARFAEILERLAPWVYVVFFTLTGLGLHVETLIEAAGAAALLWVLRAAGLWVASAIGMRLADEPPVVRRVAWRAFMPQAGIALALASTIAAEFPQMGAAVSSVIIGTVVLNEASGPFFLRSALRAAGETVSGEEVLD